MLHLRHAIPKSALELIALDERTIFRIISISDFKNATSGRLSYFRSMHTRDDAELCASCLCGMFIKSRTAIAR